MATRTYRLIYPPSLLRRTIINQVILEFELSVNIIQAHVTQEEGWLEIQVTGESEEIKRAMNWLTKEGISIVRSNTTGIFGELHAEPTDRGSSYFTMKNMTRINGDIAMITFADRDGYVYERHDKTAASFEFSTVVEKFDTFVSDCDNEENPRVTIIQYLGIATIDGLDYFMTWHTGGDLESPISCDYPQIIKYSFGHDFGI